MKLLVFAHKPPPHHGQSYMVQLLLDAFAGDAQKQTADGQNKDSPEHERIVCYHVDCRFSKGVEDIGTVGLRKLLLVFKYSFQAVAFRWRFGVRTFLYIPAPGMRSAIYRDWLVMALCRPFFSHRIFYWQAAGLGDWLNREARPWERWITHWLLGKPALSVVLGESGRADAVALESGQTAVVPNGVPDPCPDFERSVLPVRRARAAGRAGLRSGAPGNDPEIRWFKVLFVSLCTREKGLFDAVEAVAVLNGRLAQKQSPIRVQLQVAGKFWREAERKEFEERLAARDLNGGADPSFLPAVRYRGFVAGEEKKQLFTECDCFCFPSYYPAESFGIVLIEAMSFGLPIITTRWRTIPELLPSGYSGLVDPQSPAQIVARLEELVSRDYDSSLRQRFVENYTAQTFARKMRAALTSVGCTDIPAKVGRFERKAGAGD